MFEKGSGDLVLHFIAQCNAQLTEILAEQHTQVQLGQAEYVYTAAHCAVQLHYIVTSICSLPSQTYALDHDII